MELGLRQLEWSKNPEAGPPRQQPLADGKPSARPEESTDDEGLNIPAIVTSISECIQGKVPDVSPQDSSKEQHFCSMCEKKASLYCQRCSEGAGPKTTHKKTWYCSRDCQKKGWKDHKAKCRNVSAEKQLYRLGLVAQAAWYAYREQVFDMQIDRIEKRGSDLVVYEGKYGRTQIMSKFPSKLIQDREDKNALLSHLMCMDAVGSLHDFLERSLEGICEEVKEFELQFIKPRRQIHLHCYTGEKKDASHFSHLILRARLKHGKEYAIDITCAQYGYNQPVMPWSTYLEERGGVIREVCPFGTSKQRLQRLSEKAEGSSFYTVRNAVHLHHQLASEYFVKECAKYLELEGSSLTKLLQSKYLDFTRDAVSMLVVVTINLAAFQRGRMLVEVSFSSKERVKQKTHNRSYLAKSEATAKWRCNCVGQ